MSSGLRKNMRNRLLSVRDKLLLRKRAIVETIVGQLKNICQIEHSRHRSPVNFLARFMTGLIVYRHQPKNPAWLWTMALHWPSHSPCADVSSYAGHTVGRRSDA